MLRPIKHGVKAMFLSKGWRDRAVGVLVALAVLVIGAFATDAIDLEPASASKAAPTGGAADFQNS